MPFGTPENALRFGILSRTGNIEPGRLRWFAQVAEANNGALRRSRPTRTSPQERLVPSLKVASTHTKRKSRQRVECGGWIAAAFPT